jgi:hypothetical protein
MSGQTRNKYDYHFLSIINIYSFLLLIVYFKNKIGFFDDLNIYF